MDKNELSVDRELLQVALIIFSAVSLATLEFIKNAFPHVDAVKVPITAVVLTIILVQVVPAVILIAVDRAIAARDNSGKALRRFRAALFAIALLLLIRQLQLFWGTGEDIADAVRSTSVILLVLLYIAILAGIVMLCVRGFRGVLLFFYYMSPVAVALTAILPFQVPTGRALPEVYDQEVVSEEQPESKTAVFILIMDELAYAVLVNDEKLDANSFPNFAALADDGVWFTNATSNNFRTKKSTALIIRPATSLAEQFDVRLYLQYPPVEKGYIRDCGLAYTCRGAGYLTEKSPLFVAANLGLRSLYEATPDALETLMKTPVGWLVNGIDSAYPQVDTPGYHFFTKRIFDTMLNDIDEQDTPGRLHVLHMLLPHAPFSFNEDGEAINASRPDSFKGLWEQYRSQTMFADLQLGRLIQRLKDEGIYDQSVIVITADHGLRGVVPSPDKPINVIQRMVQVPLLIRAPGMNGQISDVDYQHIDFGATLMDVLGLPLPEDTSGVSAFSRERPEREKIFHVDDWTYEYSRDDDSWQISQE